MKYKLENLRWKLEVYFGELEKIYYPIDNLKWLDKETNPYWHSIWGTTQHTYGISCTCISSIVRHINMLPENKKSLYRKKYSEYTKYKLKEYIKVKSKRSQNYE